MWYTVFLSVMVWTRKTVPLCGSYKCGYFVLCITSVCYDGHVTWLFVIHMSRIVTKPTQWHVRPAKTQISLGIRPVWSESSLSAWRKLGSLNAQRRLWSDWADAQADLSLRWAHMPFCWFCHDAAHIVWMTTSVQCIFTLSLWARVLRRRWFGLASQTRLAVSRWFSGLFIVRP